MHQHKPPKRTTLYCNMGIWLDAHLHDSTEAKGKWDDSTGSFKRTQANKILDQRQGLLGTIMVPIPYT